MKPLALDAPGLRLRWATPADNDDICGLFREVHVAGELDLRQERDPDFFALSGLHHGTAHTVLARDDAGRAAAIGTLITRDGWLDGEPIRTGYLCDLRVRPGFRGGASLARHMGEVLRRVGEETGARVFETVIFDDNALARGVLTGKGAARRGQPTYHVMTPFRMTAVQFAHPRRGPRRWRVERATTADLPALKRFLAERGRGRALGWDFSGDLLERRLADWPGFGIGSFLLARAGSELVGCCAPWDTSAVKRTRVLGYHGRMAWVKRAFDVGATLLRVPRLPPAGDCFRFAFLTHLEVRDDDPSVLEDLLRAAYRDLRPTGLHFASAFVPVGSPLEAAFAGFVVQHTAMTLYAVPVPGAGLEDRPSWRAERPGFEMALS